ncbi:hypothetical protein Tco_0759961 [Tanacetum coccineum]
MALPPRDQRYPFLRFEGLEYTDVDIADFKGRLGKIYDKGVRRVLVFYFEGLKEEMAEVLSTRMLMEHTNAQGQSIFTSYALRQLFETRGPLVHKLILEFFSTFRMAEGVIDLDVVGRKRRVMISLGQFVARLAKHFGLLTKQRLQGLTDELVRLHICERLDDTWAWVAPGPERQPNAAT